ncbi:hypothetical protein ACJJTC_018176 [Scirpophaga incertulas]
MWRIILSVMVICVGVHAFTEMRSPYETKGFPDEVIYGRVFKNADGSEKQIYTREEDSYRLPNTTKPIHYNVWWKININPPILTFSGTVDIDLHATQPNVDNIVIHSYNLSIDSLNLKLNEKNIDQTYSFDLDHQFLIIKLNNGSLKYNAQVPVNYRLSIAFNAPLRTDMSGIYSSWYLNFGKIHWMAISMFEKTFARYAFPCYNEPALKATFDITITRQKNFKSWSNMMRKETRASVYDGYEDDVYHTTPVMSTYIIAMIVAEFDSVTKVEQVQNTKEVVYEVIARPDAIQTGQGEYLFELGQTLLEKLIEYTGIDYYSVNKNMKLTHAAIPDYIEEAMENWGLITYKESNLMYDGNNTGTDQKQFMTRLLTHEMSHSWFGNLVSLDWWDVTWLKEGYATYFEYFISDKVTDMGYAMRFVNDQVQLSLLADSFDGSQPLTNTDDGSPSSISAMFSTITYRKGASVIRMTDHLLGSENHKLGLRKYLKARAFKTARPIDLFENLQNAAMETGAIAQYGPDFNFIDYYKTWTEQGGHPILDVEVNRQAGIVTIRQRPFNLNTGYSTQNKKWIIPITFATARHPDFSNTKPTHNNIIKDANTTLNLALGSDEWIIFNKQQTGFYRVNYDEHSWDLIVDILRGPKRELIHEINRAQIVDDVFQFARSGIMTYKKAFDILKFLKNETAFAPWLSALYGFGFLNNQLKGTQTQKAVYGIYGSAMCRFGSQECITTARKLFADLYNWGIEVPASMRRWVYCNGLREGNPNYYNFLFNRFIYHPVNDEQVQILSSLGCTTDENSLISFLDTIFKQNFTVRAQDFQNAYSDAAGDANESNTQVTFRYVRSVSAPLFYISFRLRTEDEVKQFQDWVTTNKALLGDSYQAVFNSANSTLQRLKWAASFRDDINLSD